MLALCARGIRYDKVVIVGSVLWDLFLWVLQSAGISHKILWTLGTMGITPVLFLVVMLYDDFVRRARFRVIERACDTAHPGLRDALIAVTFTQSYFPRRGHPGTMPRHALASMFEVALFKFTHLNPDDISDGGIWLAFRYRHRWRLWRESEHDHVASRHESTPLVDGEVDDYLARVVAAFDLVRGWDEDARRFVELAGATYRDPLEAVSCAEQSLEQLAQVEGARELCLSFVLEQLERLRITFYDQSVAEGVKVIPLERLTSSALTLARG
jgi:hypothetical protein